MDAKITPRTNAISYRSLIIPARTGSESVAYFARDPIGSTALRLR
jgi:hypothetical protein